MNGFLRALGAGGEAFAGTVDERAAHYRSHLAERPAIVILDNAADYDQIRPLLPGETRLPLSPAASTRRTSWRAAVVCIWNCPR